MTYGFWRLKIGIDEWKYESTKPEQFRTNDTNADASGSELGREKMWSRIHLTPLLQAEEDRDQVRRYYANKEREKDLLGGETRIYHSDRLVAKVPLSNIERKRTLEKCNGNSHIQMLTRLCNSFVRPTFTAAPPPDKE